MVRDARRTGTQRVRDLPFVGVIDVVKVPAGNGAVALERSSAEAEEQAPIRPMAKSRNFFIVSFLMWSVSVFE
jgi:hypothetical protein